MGFGPVIIIKWVCHVAFCSQLPDPKARRNARDRLDRIGGELKVESAARF